MDIDRFDAVARLFATRRSRRAAVRGGAVAVAAMTLLTARASAQEATPEVTAITDPHPSADFPTDPEYLFVQPFASGTWTPKAGEDGTYMLTLSGAAANTVYFSDRPERAFGLARTQRFLDALGFTPADPPNAALVAKTSDGGDEDVLVIELLNPDYDAAAGTLTYDARILADYSGEGLKDAARRQADYALPDQFSEGSLFIDDCPDGRGTCYQIVNGEQRTIGSITDVGMCFNTNTTACDFCNNDPKSSYYGRLCAEAFPDVCHADVKGSEFIWDCYVTDLQRPCHRRC